MSGRNSSMVRKLGAGVVGLGLAAFVAAPAVAEETHAHNVRPPRSTVEHTPHIHGHAEHKPPPSFAPQIQDHPVHKPHPGLQPGPTTPDVVIHIRAPHKNHNVAPIVVVPGPERTRKTHVIVHSSVKVNKTPIVLTKRQKPTLTHPAKISTPPTKIQN